MSLFYIFPSTHSYTLKMGALNSSETLVHIYHTQDVKNQNVIRNFHRCAYTYFNSSMSVHASFIHCVICLTTDP